MFAESSTARTFLRASITTVLAFLGALGTAIVDNAITPVEWVMIATATVGAFGAYLGVGAVVPQAEPFFGNRMDRVEVPVPPATRDSG